MISLGLRKLVCVGMITAALHPLAYAAPIQLTLEGIPSIDFGEVQPGSRKDLNEINGYHTSAKIESSENSVWSLYIKADDLLTSGPNTIAGNNFRWATWYAGFYKTGGPGSTDWYHRRAGLANLGTEISFIPLDNKLVYTSGASDDYPAFNDINHNGGYTEVQFQFILDIPYSQAPGDYATTITYTVTQ